MDWPDIPDGRTATGEKLPRMVEHLDRAPARSQNFGGERTFGYMAELDILGWKFVVRADGSILIETPIVDGGQPTIALSSYHRDLITALFDLPDEEPVGVVGIAPDAPGLGRGA